MPIESVTELVQFLTRYPLLEPVQRDELDWILKARFTDPRILAKELVLRDWLTPYQVNHLFQGQITDLMLGSYVLLERLTEGALGQLFKARHLHMKRTVALQVVRPELLKDPAAVQRFYGEVQTVSQLSHQNLVAAYDAGPIGNTHFFAMEYGEGIDLERHIQQKGPLTVPQACEAIRQTARGLQHAFKRGLLHHDLRPANLLLMRNPERGPRTTDESGESRLPEAMLVKVRNLGLTLIRQHTKHTRLLAGPTPEPAMPDYLAPEQAAGGAPADVRSELYSLGGTFYFLLTGNVPFPGGTAQEKIRRHQIEAPTPIEVLRPEVPADIAALVARLMAKDPAQRYADPSAVADILSPPAETVVIPGTVDEPVVQSEKPKPQAKPLPPVKTRRRPLLVVGSVGLVAALLWLGWAWVRQGGSAAVPTTAADSVVPAVVAVSVEANRTWQDTGIDVRPDVPIVLYASGKWRGGPRQSACSPDGDQHQPLDRNLITDAKSMALVGWVSGEDAPFVIGVRKTYIPKANGRLFVQANDLDTKDNSGQVKLQIKGGERSTGLAVLWQPGYGEWDEAVKRVKDFRSMTYRPKENRWVGPMLPDPQHGPIWVNGVNAHPGPYPKLCIVRRWQVSRDAVVAFTGTLHHPRGEGNGVRGWLVCNGKNVLVNGPWEAHNRQTPTNVPRIRLRCGDMVDAVVDSRGDYGFDHYTWALDVRVVETPEKKEPAGK